MRIDDTTSMLLLTKLITWMKKCFEQYDMIILVACMASLVQLSRTLWNSGESFEGIFYTWSNMRGT